MKKWVWWHVHKIPTFLSDGGIIKWVRFLTLKFEEKKASCAYATFLKQWIILMAYFYTNIVLNFFLAPAMTAMLWFYEVNGII